MNGVTTLALGLVAVGGAAGAVGRWATGLWVGTWGAPWTGPFPWGIFLINVAGSLLIGVLAAGFAHHWLHAHAYTLLATGVCGGFTTFSTFSLDNLKLLQLGNPGLAFANMAASVAAGLAAVAIGWYAASRF